MRLQGRVVLCCWLLGTHLAISERQATSCAFDDVLPDRRGVRRLPGPVRLRRRSAAAVLGGASSPPPLSSLSSLSSLAPAALSSSGCHGEVPEAAAPELYTGATAGEVVEGGGGGEKEGEKERERERERRWRKDSNECVSENRMMRAKEKEAEKEAFTAAAGPPKNHCQSCFSPDRATGLCSTHLQSGKLAMHSCHGLACAAGDFLFRPQRAFGLGKLKGRGR